MAIDFSQVKEVKYNNQDVTKIERSGVTLWEKIVDPTANILQLTGTTLASYNSGTIYAKGRYNNDTNNMSSFKVWWTLMDIPDFNYGILDSNKKIIFPYKTSKTGSTDSKFGIGSARANASNKISSGTAQYGLTLTNGFDMTPYFKGNYYNTYDIYGGSFTVTPGSSSTYLNKCLAGFLLENLYESGTQITDLDIEVQEVGTDISEQRASVIWCNNKVFKLNEGPGMEDWGALDNKLLKIVFQIKRIDNTWQKFIFFVCVEKES